ncbi:erythromycin esterase family protein [Glycomyces tritici]|uniref:Erythromycin esterase family protein n=1 Tax=Glycomyces tritici TaxID=2665176 RepID=A0ABT7YTH9_9ACTN|nr:erythromycin esterase family protein [Glycomyces tritici]MDN3241907.1 erythromycin esterase family protein [Glycomyces tritici]
MNESANGVRQWLEAAARPVDDFAALRGIIGDAEVVAFGETTRAAHEIDHYRLQAFRFLVEELGFRALAVNDDAIVAERLDDYVRRGDDDPAEALGAAWPPWRTEETVAVLEWMRAYNREHPADPVRLFGTNAAGAQAYHYDAVVDYVRRAAPGRLDELKAHLAPPRSAHRIDEHVQRFRGVHPGKPFAESAREAHDLVASLPADPERDHVLRYARTIWEHHSSTVAAGVDFGAAMKRVAGEILRQHERTGAKTVFWDGIAAVAASDAMSVGIGSGEPFTSVGGHLRERLGAKYLPVMIGFGEGEIHEGVKVPAPPADYVEAVLRGDEPFVLDLRTAPEEAAAWLRGSRKVRVVPGVYDPAEDEKHHVVAPSFAAWFDAFAYFPRIGPTAVLRSR